MRILYVHNEKTPVLDVNGVFYRAKLPGFLHYGPPLTIDPEVDQLDWLGDVDQPIVRQYLEFIAQTMGVRELLFGHFEFRQRFLRLVRAIPWEVRKAAIEEQLERYQHELQQVITATQRQMEVSGEDAEALATYLRNLHDRQIDRLYQLALAD